jgi:hypothetical protein
LGSGFPGILRKHSKPKNEVSATNQKSHVLPQINAPEVPAYGHCLECAPRVGSAPILHFYPGKNTPERKGYLMERLVVPVK